VIEQQAVILALHRHNAAHDLHTVLVWLREHSASPPTSLAGELRRNGPVRVRRRAGTTAGAGTKAVLARTLTADPRPRAPVAPDW